MKERPILFSAPMVRAILGGRKTQTRRAVKISHRTPGLSACLNPPVGAPRLRTAAELCPYGQPGDRLWVRETFSGPYCMEASEGCAAAPPSKWGRSSDIWYWADGNPPDGDWTRPRPSIHMPRWASRILLEVTDVRVERLKDISEADCIAEGAPGGHGSIPGYNYAATPDEHYRHVWESINGPGSWDANPFVWCISFRRITA